MGEVALCITSMLASSALAPAVARPPKPDTLALTPHDELEACAMLRPPLSVVLVKVDAIDISVVCSTDASKLADAPALYYQGGKNHASLELLHGYCQMTMGLCSAPLLFCCFKHKT